MNEKIRTRIAPSPTGPFHLGTARTALFNWIFAKQNGGKLILRIEDTDKERSEKKYEKEILESLTWLGLVWDEGPDKKGGFGPYRQSERGKIYEKHVNDLLEKGIAYYCFCSREQLEQEREAMLAQGYPPKYSGRCKNIDHEKAKSKSEKESSVIRLKIGGTDISFNDIIRGKITFDSNLIGDIVIAKNKESPLYNLAVVIDDAEMEISHVIRGEDHIANTPKQISIQEALGFKTPIYAHLPLILSHDRSKLSKRYVDTAILDYKKMGYLPNALINFLVLLGWHPSAGGLNKKNESEKELYSMEELSSLFNLKKVQKSGAAFSIEKLNWINGQYIKSSSSDELINHLGGLVPDSWLTDKAKLSKIMDVEKARIEKLSELLDSSRFFFEIENYDSELLVWKDSNREETAEHLKKLQEILKGGGGEKEVMEYAEEKGKGNVLWPLRVALSGKSASPGPFEIMTILEKSEIMDRVKNAISKL